MASSAQDVLANAQVFATIDEAVATCQLLVGTTARARHRVETLLPAEAGPRIVAAAADGLEVGILFGREDSGLTADEMRLATS
jgi:tRNA (cytidine32/uridine32-2'-O)-methyltransferase